MRRIYVTFGQNHIHPISKVRLKDYWIEIYVNKPSNAMKMVVNKFGLMWYSFHEEWNFDSHYYPKGRYEVMYDKAPRITKYNKYGRNRITNKRKTFQRGRLQQN